jgi:hypothetical protein
MLEKMKLPYANPLRTYWSAMCLLYLVSSRSKLENSLEIFNMHLIIIEMLQIRWYESNANPCKAPVFGKADHTGNGAR